MGEQPFDHWAHRAGERAGADRHWHPAAASLSSWAIIFARTVSSAACAASGSVRKPLLVGRMTWRSCTAPSSPRAAPPAWPGFSSLVPRVRASAAAGVTAADLLLEGSRRAMRVAQLKEIDRLEQDLRRCRRWAAPARTWACSAPCGNHECVLIARKRAAGDAGDGGARHFRGAGGDPRSVYLRRFPRWWPTTASPDQVTPAGDALRRLHRGVLHHSATARGAW